MARERFPTECLGPALNINALDLLHRLRVEHADRAATAETVMGLGIQWPRRARRCW